MIEMLILLAAGVALLGAGGHYLVEGAASTARRFSVSPLFIGIALVGLGTSAPELATSLTALSQGSEGIALGNIVGSNIANILLVGGATGLFFGALTIARSQLLRDGGFGVIAAGLMVLALSTTGLVAPWGVAFLLLISAYLFICFKQERVAPVGAAMASGGGGPVAGGAPPVEDHGGYSSLMVASFATLGGLIAVLAGARFTTEAAIAISDYLGWSETVVGLTIVAVGTSLPEIAASFAAAFRGMASMALGNILGSNIFNMLLIGGAIAFASSGDAPRDIVQLDAPVALGAAILLLLVVYPRSRLGAFTGAFLLAGYALYIALMPIR